MENGKRLRGEQEGLCIFTGIPDLKKRAEIGQGIRGGTSSPPLGCPRVGSGKGGKVFQKQVETKG